MRLTSQAASILCCALMTWGALGGRPASAREVSPDEKMLWSCYMICWSLNRDFHDFYDRPLDRPPRDGSPVRLADLRRAVEAGVDALSIDLFMGDKYALPAFGELVKLINEHHLPLQLSPMFDGLADPGLSLDDTTAKIQQWFERFAHEPCVVRTGGRPVLFTFSANSLTPAQWQTLQQRLKAAGHEGYWIGELSHYLAVGEKPDFAAARPWLDLFPAANSFNVHNPQRARDVIAGYRDLFPTGHAWVAPVAIGYWRPEIAVYTSRRGTALYRETWQAVIDADVRWVQQSTWNDFSECHQIMPSENAGVTFVDLNRHLAAQWKQHPADEQRPRLYLSQPQEVQVGDEAQLELLALAPAARPITLRLTILGADGRRVHAFPDAPGSDTGLSVASFRLPVGEIPPQRVLIPDGLLLDARGATLAHVRGPELLVTAAGYRPERNYSWLHTADGTECAGLCCTLQLGEALEPTAAVPAHVTPKVTVHAESPVELADVEILHNGCQMLSLRRDVPAQSLAAPVDWQGTLVQNRRKLLDWGVYTARAITTDGRMATSRPIFIDRPAEAGVTLGLWTFDADSDRDVLDSSPWLHDGRLGGRPRRAPWFPVHVADPWGGKCLQFDGVDDRVLLEGAIVPPRDFTVEGWIKPAGSAPPEASGQILFAVASATVVLSLDRRNHLQVSRKCNGRWHAVTDRQPVTPDQWQHVAATYDGAMLRLYRNGQLCGEQAAAGDGKAGQVAIGYNSVTNQSFYHGALDDLRLSAEALSPERFGPHNPLREAPPR